MPSRSISRKPDAAPIPADCAVQARALRSAAPDEPTVLEPFTVRIPIALKLTGIGRTKLYELIASGDIEIVKVGTATLVTMASLRRLVTRGAPG